MTKAYGEELLVVWNHAEELRALDLDPSTWKWAPDAPVDAILGLHERIRTFRQRRVPLQIYQPDGS